MAGNYGTFHLYMPQLTWNWFLIVAAPCITQQLGCIWHLLWSRVDSVPALCSCVFIETVMQNVSLTQSVCTSSRPQLVLAVVSVKHHPQEAPPTGNFVHRKFLLLISTSSAAKNTQFLKINCSSHTVLYTDSWLCDRSYYTVHAMSYGITWFWSKYDVTLCCT